jgi:serine phosphatase RsbU (regulator of sigma subunit)
MFRILSLILLLICLIPIAYGQENASELEKELKSSKGKDKFDILYNLSKIYLKQTPKKSVDYGKKAISEAKKLNNRDLQADANNLVGTAYYNLDDYKGALKYYEEELEIRQSLKQESSCMKILFNLGTIYESYGKASKSIVYFEQALEASKKLKLTPIVFQCYDALIRLYTSEKEYKEAFNHLRAFMTLKAISLPSDEHKKIAILETKFKEEKQAKEETEEVLKKKDSTLNIVKNEKEQLEGDTAVKGQAISELTIETKEQKLIILQKEELVKRQRQLIFSFIIFITVVMLFSILLYRQYKAKKKAHQMLLLQNAEIRLQKEEILSQSEKLIEFNVEIEEQKEEIESQAEQLTHTNKQLVKQRDEILHQKSQITDSIHYASRIQNVMLPSKETLDEIFTEWLVLWKPQEIVSGDFYWVRKINNLVVFAAADCTGHGVPGAFMSMLGISFLNEIVTKSRYEKSNEILNQLRKQIKSALNQTGKANEATDGMDMALCILDIELNILQFSGANNPLYLIRDNELQVIKPDMQPIAIYPREQDFTYNEIKVKKGDVIYLFSDGFIDQFGGEYGERLKASRFKTILTEIHQHPLKEQKKILYNFFDKWKGTRFPQIDDILILGIRI